MSKFTVDIKYGMGRPLGIDLVVSAVGQIPCALVDPIATFMLGVGTFLFGADNQLSK